MGVPTACDTVRALAPGYEALILTVGGVMAGYWSTGSIFRPMIPTMTITMEITAEKMGRRMKKFACMAYGFLVLGDYSTGGTACTSIPGLSLW